MVLQNYQNVIEMNSNIIYNVALGVGLKCPRKIHLNTQSPPGSDRVKRANDIQMRFYKNFLAPLFSLSLSLGHFFSSWGKRRLKFLHSTSSTVHQATPNRLVTLGQCTLYDLTNFQFAVWTSNFYSCWAWISVALFPSFTQNLFTLSWNTKGQLISKCPYEKSVSSKIPTKIFLESCPEIFCSFLGASWKLFGLPGDIVSNIIHKEAYRKPQKASRKPQGSYKKFQGRNPEIISLLFREKLIFHKDIIKLTDL